MFGVVSLDPKFRLLLVVAKMAQLWQIFSSTISLLQHESKIEISIQLFFPIIIIENKCFISRCVLASL